MYIAFKDILKQVTLTQQSSEEQYSRDYSCPAQRPLLWRPVTAEGEQRGPPILCSSRVVGCGGSCALQVQRWSSGAPWTVSRDPHMGIRVEQRDPERPTNQMHPTLHGQRWGFTWIINSTAVAGVPKTDRPIRTHLNLSITCCLSSVYKLDSWFRLIQHIAVDSRDFFLWMGPTFSVDSDGIIPFCLILLCVPESLSVAL